MEKQRLESMQAHMDEGGKLGEAAAHELYAEVIRLRGALAVIRDTAADCERINNLGALRSQLGGKNKIGRTVINIHGRADEALKETGYVSTQA